MVKRVLLAMSGGVDSSVAALLLQRQGYDVVGIFMRTGVQHEESCDTQASHKKGCCSSLDARDARRVADRLSIPFYAIDFAAEFDRIIDYFVSEYAEGRTPNPCVMCNNWLKFGKLWDFGQQLGADFIATGHYAQVLRGEQGPELHAAVNPAKDQSYVLHGIRREMLDRLIFPIGGHAKGDIRALARAAELPVFDKPDSQEICFVPNGDYASVVRQRRQDLNRPGHIVDTAGNRLAEHDGIEQFTIGQRKGLGFAAGARRYVLQIVPADNTVIVGEREECLSAGLLAERLNWLVDAPVGASIRCEAKIRYRTPPVPAHVTPMDDGRAVVQFDEPQLAVTPGQAVVFYDGTRVLGGGWITTGR